MALVPLIALLAIPLISDHFYQINVTVILDIMMTELIILNASLAIIHG